MYTQQLPDTTEEYSLTSSTRRYPIIKCFYLTYTDNGENYKFFFVVTTRAVFYILYDRILPFQTPHDNPNTEIGDFIVTNWEGSNIARALLDHGNKMFFIDYSSLSTNPGLTYPIYGKLVKCCHSNTRIFVTTQ
jgi:hypothetical protein